MSDSGDAMSEMPVTKTFGYMLGIIRAYALGSSSSIGDIAPAWGAGWLDSMGKVEESVCESPYMAYDCS